MLGRKSRKLLELFVTGCLEQLVPEDHVLARVTGFSTWAGCARQLRTAIATTTGDRALIPRSRCA